MAIDMSKVKFVEVVDDPADFDDDQAMDDAEEQEQQQQQKTVAGMLSKSWTVASAHVPTFTGGRVMHSYHCTPPPNATDEDTESIERGNQNPFLLLPVHGDVAVVDATKGVKLGTVRGGSGADAEGGYSGGDPGDDEDDDEEDGVDQDGVMAYALDHKNKFIMTCARNNMMRQYSVVRSLEEKELNEMDEVDQEDNDQDERRLLTKTQLIHTWGRSGHTLPVTIMAYHDSDVFLATGSVDGTVRIWDTRGRYVTHVFRPLTGGRGGEALGGGRSGVCSITWKPGVDKLIVAIGREDGSVSVHDLRDPMDDLERVVVLRDHLSAVTCMDWWGDEFFVSTGRDAILNLWRIVVTPVDEAEEEKKKKKNKRKSKNLKPAAASPPKDRITYRRIQTIPVYEQIEGMIVLPPTLSTDNEIRIITAGSKGSLRRWKAEVIQGQTPDLVQTLQQLPSESFGEDRGGYMGLVLNQTAVAQGSSDEFLIAVDAEHNLSFVDHMLSLNRTIVGHNDEILDLKIISSQGGSSNSIVVATNSPQVRVFDLENFSCSVLDGHSATVLCVDASPCGRYLASAGKDKTLRLWSTDTYQCVGIAEGHTEPIGACGMSQKVGRYEVGGKAARNGGGAFVVTASIDKTLKRWNLLGPDDWDENEPIELEAATSIRGHDKDINIISIAPNDSVVASGSQDKTVKLWSATDLSLRATLKGHRRGVWDCQFSPIDRVLATSSGDKTIKLWSLSDYSCVRTFQGHLSSVLRVRFLSTGLQLMSAGADGLLKLWTIRTNECESTLDGHSNKVWAMDLTSGSDRDFVVSGAADSKILVWNDTTAELEDEERAQEAERILLDQKMTNHLRHKEYDKALDIALQVDKPHQALKILTALLENEITTSKTKQGKQPVTILQKHVAEWDLDRIAQVLKYCREWNTRARNSALAMWVVQAIVTTITVDRLTSKEATETKHGNISEILAGITPYAERHFDRVDRLYSNTYLLDFILVNMSSLDPMVGKKDSDMDAEFAAWEAKSKPVLPPKFIDGRIQKGGQTIVGSSGNAVPDSDEDNSDNDDDSDAVMTVGDSSSSESEDGDSEDENE
jgi:U3 small nucleolar RNA-associated protein 13